MNAMVEMMTVKPEEMECCICYDVIGKQNNCTTPCGHSFCFECMMKSLGRNNTCPCCRAVLKEEEEEESDEEYEEEESDEDDEYERTRLDGLASPEEIGKRLTKMGYTLTDILSLYMNRINRDDPRYTREFTEKLVNDFDEIVENADEEIESEMTEREEMGGEDIRRRLFKEGTIFDIDPTFTLSSLFEESSTL